METFLDLFATQAHHNNDAPAMISLCFGSHTLQQFPVMSDMLGAVPFTEQYLVDFQFKFVKNQVRKMLLDRTKVQN